MKPIKMGDCSPTHVIIPSLSLPDISVFRRHDKDSEFQGDRQYPCTTCVNWTRCIGYYQWVECKCRMLRQGGAR